MRHIWITGYDFVPYCKRESGIIRKDFNWGINSNAKKAKESKRESILFNNFASYKVWARTVMLACHPHFDEFFEEFWANQGCAKTSSIERRAV